uniref:Uncharacterized protein n=1 Tax=Kalanchoe fedtschenkoi TaxID=63787 RepID=A0A7N0T5J7_KALFE
MRKSEAAHIKCKFLRPVMVQSLESGQRGDPRDAVNLKGGVLHGPISVAGSKAQRDRTLASLFLITADQKILRDRHALWIQAHCADAVYRPRAWLTSPRLDPQHRGW